MKITIRGTYNVSFAQKIKEGMFWLGQREQRHKLHFEE